MVAVGSGFATSFFLARYLRESRGKPSVLVLESGRNYRHEDLLRLRLTDKDPESLTFQRQFYENRAAKVRWRFFRGFGGGSNCWYAATPRMLPEDFRLKTLFGVGSDWPLDYHELSPYYAEAERLLRVSGESGCGPYPDPVRYPLPAHALSSTDRILRRMRPDRVFPSPSARPSQPAGTRQAVCCGNAVCALCPIDSKFTISNAMSELYGTDNLRLECGARVVGLERKGGRVSGVTYEQDGRLHEVRGDLIVLGANAIFNPALLLDSGFSHPQLGRGLCGKESRSVSVHLSDQRGLDGGSYCTALSYQFYKDRDRGREAAALVQCRNRPRLRDTFGKWSNVLDLYFMFEDFRQPTNFVTMPENGGKPVTEFQGSSPQTRAAVDHLRRDVERLVEGLAVDDIIIHENSRNHSHIMGTTVMGRSPEDSVADPDGLLHEARNVVVLGGGLFPTTSASNPTLTLCALALRSADRLAG